VSTPLEIDGHMIDVLLPDLVGHDKRPAAFILYLWLWIMTRGVGRKKAFFSHRSEAGEEGQ
jgi:hypothetical protein